MLETYSAFGDYIRRYDLHRAEGILLRHINSVILLNPEARNVRHTYITLVPAQKIRQVQQALVDMNEHNDWVVGFKVDLALSRERGGTGVAVDEVWGGGVR
jgi:hypothetical protein